MNLTCFSLLDMVEPINPKIGYLGSSNLTMAGLSRQGELNVNVLDHDACDKLFEFQKAAVKISAHHLNKRGGVVIGDVVELGETEFIRRHHCPVRSLAAFEKGEHADDWRDLMRLYLVRRTRPSSLLRSYAGAGFALCSAPSEAWRPTLMCARTIYDAEYTSDAGQYKIKMVHITLDTPT